MAQHGKNIVVAYKVEGTFNTAPGATGAKQFRPIAGNGLSLQRAQIASAEIRSDGQTSMGRLGSNSVAGSYAGELSIGSFDELIEAVFRSAWVAAATITEATASLASITTTTSTIVASGGSWITAGVKVGDVIRITNHATAANNSINLIVKSVTASTITVHGAPLTANAVADTAFTITILKKLKNGSAPTRRTFYFEEYHQDLDVSEVFGGCRIVSLRLRGQPDGMCIAEFGIVGASGSPLASGSSPYYASPTQYTSLALVWNDAAIYFAGAAITTLTAFEVFFELGGSTLPVIGGGNTTPDVFENDMKVSGSITGLRTDLANLTRLGSETELEFQALLVEPESEPKDCMSIFLPRIKLTTVEAPFGNDGGMVETMNFMGGKKESTSGYDDTMATICSSAA